MKKTIHLVCNAHLDPVWQWTWEDGLAEAVSTFRIAVDFCEKHPDFVFNHNESLLYGWVKDHEPKLFSRIQQLVAQKQWHIAGGAYLQPDVNVPMGETHIRQFLYGLSFFKTHFNTRPTTAYNFDPFGHPEGFVQILVGCGMNGYLFCRPEFGTYDLPAGCFTWTDRSGKSITARRSDDHYLTASGTEFDIDRKFPRFLEHYKDESTTLLLWGIGNHGGGVSHSEYRKILRFFRKHPEYEFKHSTPETFITHARMLNENFPVIHGELERNYAGCYTSMGRVKQALRAAEHLLLQTETQAALAWWFDGVTYPQQVLDNAWQDVMFNTFHDILPGSGISDVEKDALAQLGRVTTDLRALRMRILINRVQNQTKAKDGHVPIFISNPHGFAVNRTVAFEYATSNLFSIGSDKKIVLKCKGKMIPYQRVSPQHNCVGMWIVRLVVNVMLQPYEILRLDASLVDSKLVLPKRRKVNQKSLCFMTRHGQLVINPNTGLIDSLVPMNAHRSIVKPDAMQPVLFEDLDHSWSCGDPKQLTEPKVAPMGPAWDKPDEYFTLACDQQAADFSPLAADKWSKSSKTQAQAIRIIEDGPIQTIVEVLFVCGPSSINRHYIISHADGRVEICDRIFYNHKDHMLKLHIPLNILPEQSRSETCYSVMKHPPADRYVEQLNKRWVAVEAEDGTFLAILNDASNAHNLTHEALAINVLRSPAYSSFLMRKDDPYNDHRFTPRQDQGEHVRRYELIWGKDLCERSLTQEAMLLNSEPYANIYYPHGRSKTNRPRHNLRVTPSNVQIAAVKKAQHDDALVVRLQELDGQLTHAKLYIQGNKPIRITVDAYNLATVMIHQKDEQIIGRLCNLVEDH